MAVFLWDFCVQGGEGVHEIYLLGSYAFLAAAFCFLRCRLNDNEQKGSLSSTICCFGMSSSLGFCFVGGGGGGGSDHPTTESECLLPVHLSQPTTYHKLQRYTVRLFQVPGLGLSPFLGILERAV